MVKTKQATGRVLWAWHAEQLFVGHTSTSSSCLCCWLLPCVSCLSPHTTVARWQLFFQSCSEEGFKVNSLVYFLPEVIFLAGSSFSSLHDHMDTGAAGTQRFTARRKPLERMTGWWGVTGQSRSATKCQTTALVQAVSWKHFVFWFNMQKHAR